MLADSHFERLRDLTRSAGRAGEVDGVPSLKPSNVGITHLATPFSAVRILRGLRKKDHAFVAIVE